VRRTASRLALVLTNTPTGFKDLDIRNRVVLHPRVPKTEQVANSIEITMIVLLILSGI